MKVLILGSTGSIGRHLVPQALALGHEVTVLVRDPSKLEARHECLRGQGASQPERKGKSENQQEGLQWRPTP